MNLREEIKKEIRKNTHLIIFHESVLHSWLKDAGTFGSFIIVITINYFLLNNNIATNFILLIMWFLWTMVGEEKISKNFCSKEDAINYINKLSRKKS